MDWLFALIGKAVVGYWIGYHGGYLLFAVYDRLTEGRR